MHNTPKYIRRFGFMGGCIQHTGGGVIGWCENKTMWKLIPVVVRGDIITCMYVYVYMSS